MSYVLFLAVVLMTILQFRLLGDRDDAAGRKRRWWQKTPAAAAEGALR